MHSLDLPEPDEHARAHSDHLRALLREYIAAHGPMPFHAFMERCLYAPGLGYYSAGSRKFGAAGDFVTSAELGPVFARCVASALAPVLATLGPDADWLELGGGSGAFAEHLLLAMAQHNATPARYLMLEPSADLRARQQARLRERLPPDLYTRLQWIERPPEAPWRGILYANEVIDALPATRFVVRESEVFEEHVALDGEGRFVFQERPADALTTAAVRHLERTLKRPFPEGYRSDLLPQLPYWMQAVLGALESGLALFVDYGYSRAEYYHPERSDGTLRAFYRHHVHGDVFRYPGLQDLTTSVDFTALAEAGKGAGFHVAAYVPQGKFLAAAGLAQVHAEAAEGLDEGGLYALAQEIKRLMLPEAMGERFQAMLLARGETARLLPAEILIADHSPRL